jgi:hypothetical protein
MSDYGAVLILASIFVAMLYAGFETRIFASCGSHRIGAGKPGRLDHRTDLESPGCDPVSLPGIHGPVEHSHDHG